MSDTEYPCPQCGAIMAFAPGTDALACTHCGYTEGVDADDSVTIEELDYEEALAALARGDTETADQATEEEIDCEACGAVVTVPAHVAGAECPFCGTPYVRAPHAKCRFQPRGVIPFAVPERDAKGQFQGWAGKQWLAPFGFAKRARSSQALQGVYLPYWTYDSGTVTKYDGMRGDDYFVTVQGENGSRRERRTNWTPASGQVQRFFDDVLVPATTSMPDKLLAGLAPWPLNELTPYDPDYIAGFRAERYRVDLKSGFDEARRRMRTVIRGDVRRAIGGDRQRIGRMQTHHGGVTYKHILLPIWISTYRYKSKQFRFIVNGRTGRVHGERPLSWLKIGMMALAGFMLIATLAYFGAEDTGVAPYPFDPVPTDRLR